MRKKLFWALLTSLMLSFGGPAAFGASNAEFAGEPVPQIQPEVAESLDQELLLLSEAKARIWLTIRRTARYLPLVETALSKAGVHRDFRSIPLALTGLSAKYQSQGRAGLWRFSANEARALGLTVTSDLDERFDPVASSAAAASKLKKLTADYGSPVLAAAAFLDEGATLAAVTAAGGQKNFFRLYLPDTLEKSVYQVLAGKIIFDRPEAYGYSLTRTWPVLARKRQKQDQARSLKDLAAGLKVDYLTFREMNPHLLTDTVPAGAYVYLP
ncbi:MAG: transglycosylase SLT domain-containing protein [Deltaproteobacteria bacterium]|jgi:hypothetical protein|nr:transglycosylase SLT domain-containing protein [Deltaproteobacteria bacterium]